MSVSYLEESYEIIDRPVPRHGGILNLLPGQTQEGYGDKITTDRVLRIQGDKREYRVYCTCWSNAGSCWIVRDKQKLFIR